MIGEARLQVTKSPNGGGMCPPQKEALSEQEGMLIKREGRIRPSGPSGSCSTNHPCRARGCRSSQGQRRAFRVGAIDQRRTGWSIDEGLSSGPRTAFRSWLQVRSAVIIEKPHRPAVRSPSSRSGQRRTARPGAPMIVNKDKRRVTRSDPLLIRPRSR